MKAPRVEMFVCPMESPRDTGAVEALFDDDGVDPATVVALIGKTEGTGLHDDWGRTLADVCLHDLLARRTGTDRESVRQRVVTILSGGCPGVISPHVTIVTREMVEADDAPVRKALVVARARSQRIAPEEIGRMGQIRAVADATRAALDDLPLTEPGDVHCVMVKAPTLTPLSIADAESRGRSVISRDLSIGPSGAMCFSNDASALGVALALGEVAEADLSDEVVRRNWQLYSEVAATSCAGDKTDADVLVLANASPSLSSLTIGHGVLRDVIDADGVKDALRSAGLGFGCCPTQDDRDRVVQLFMKLIVPGSDVVRGSRVTLPADHDAFSLAKAIGGTLGASVTGRTAIFVSGGEANSHQGPPDGSPVAAVIRD